MRGRAKLLAGAIIVLSLSAVGVLSLVWTPLPPARLQIAHKLQPPLSFGLLGTDQLGRDMLSLLMVACWNSLSTAVVSVLAGATVGTGLGMAAAARDGLPRLVFSRLCDILFALPPVLSAMMLGAFLGGGRTVAIMAIATFMVPVFFRVALSASRQAWSRPYVLAAQALGNSRVAITTRHVLPNIASQIIAQASIQLGLAILTEAGLSFLGLGIAPPAPSFGKMLADAQTYLGLAPFLAILPGLSIALAVLGFNLLGDGLRDLFDPRETGRSRRHRRY
jgi:peptide/nickel transport system permease protein